MKLKPLLHLALTLLMGALLAGCLAPPPEEPEEPQTPWRLGTPSPLFAPLTSECPGEGSAPLHLDGVRYGINIFSFDTDMERVLNLSSIAGFGWVRQQIHWRDLEGEEGQFVWRPLDRFVSAARAHDLRIMLSIVRSPEWATSEGHTGLPDDPSTLARFLGEVAARYRGRVSAYEIWNEPNLAHESGGAPGDPSRYLATLQASYRAIKAADPCALVLSAPLAATQNPEPDVATDDLPFFEALYTLEKNTFLRSADLVAVHPGAGPHHPDERWPANAPGESHHYFRHIERIHQIMQRHGDQRQVWITEVGWTVEQAHGAPQPVSEQQQADYLVDMLWRVRQRYPRVSGVFVWNLNFAVITPPGDEKATFGILNPDWSLRPAFRSLQHNVAPLRDADEPPFLTRDAAYRFAWTFPGRGALRSRLLHAPGGAIYATSAPATLYAVSPTGRLLWQHNAPGMVSSAPARAPDGALYLADSSGTLAALAPGGAARWSKQLAAPLRGGPIVHHGHVYALTTPGEIDAFTEAGKEVWTFDLEGETTPLALSSDGALLVGTAAGDIVKVEVGGSRGREAWRASVGGDLWAPPVPDKQGGAYVATARGQVVAVDEQGRIRWQTDLRAPMVAPPLVGGNGRVYAATREGSLVALVASDGAEIWRLETGSDLRATPAQGRGGTLYLGTEDERLLAVDGRGNILWQAHLRGAVRVSPLPTPGGTLYVATASGRLYALEPAER